MKNAAQYARRVKRLVTTIKRDGGKPKTLRSEDPMDQLMRGILSRTASDYRANSAWGRLRSGTVDLNELRVTPVSELVAILGRDYPQARSVAEAISKALNSIFNHRHDLDLGFLKSASRSTAENFLKGLDGVDEHARAAVLLLSLGAHAIPVDDNMLVYLQKGEFVSETASRGEVQGFLERQIKARDGAAFYALFKRFASTHAPRPVLSDRGGSARTAAATRSGRAGSARRRPAGGSSGGRRKKVRSRLSKTGRKRVSKKRAGRAVSVRKRPARRKR